MTGHDAFDRTVAAWFEADALPPVRADVRDRILDATRRVAPRPAWLAGPGSHWVREAHGDGSNANGRPMTGFRLRSATALILLLALAALLGGAILAGARLLQPSPLLTGRLGHLAYTLDGDVYVADWDGSNAVRVADGLPGGKSGCGPAGYTSTVWSPDGRYLAYRSGLDQVSCPSVGTVDISDPRGNVVASFPGTGWLVSWSPDSTRVATWLEQFQTVGIYGLDGVRQTVLTVPPGCPMPGDFDPVWSPDGRSVVVWPCLVPVDGQPPGRLPPSDPRSRYQFAYSPDGTQVAWIEGCRCPTPAHASLVVAAADGTQSRVVLADGVYNGSPGWSPSGDRIAFVGRGEESPSALPLAYELRVVDLATGTVTPLAHPSGTDMLQVIEFSPEGDRILYVTTDANYTRTSPWSVNVDGSDTRLLVRGLSYGDFDWQLLPAGTRGD